MRLGFKLCFTINTLLYYISNCFCKSLDKKLGILISQNYIRDITKCSII